MNSTKLKFKPATEIPPGFVLKPKYKRHTSLEALIRRFVGGDVRDQAIATHYIRRWRFNDACWEADDGRWIVQPMRAFADELDFAVSTVQRAHAKLVACGAFEIVSRKLYPTAMRAVTHVRPTFVMALFLHRIGYWRQDDPKFVAYLEDKFGKECSEMMAARKATPQATLATLPTTHQGTLPSPDSLKEYKGWGAINLFEMQIPAPPAAGADVPHSSLENKEQAPPTPPKVPGPHMSSATAKKPANFAALDEGIKGQRQKLWSKAAGLIRNEGIMFPMVATRAEMARLWDFRSLVRAAWSSEEPFWGAISAAASDWSMFHSWLMAAGVSAKSIPANFDLLYLHKQATRAVQFYIAIQQYQGVELPWLDALIAPAESGAGGS